MQRSQLLFRGMSGIGDCLHQRAIVPIFMREHEVWLRTSWPQLYHDMPDLCLSPLYRSRPRFGRTQIKNERRSSRLYKREPTIANEVCCMWEAGTMRGGTSSFVQIMAKSCGIVATEPFRLPIREDWSASIEWIFAQAKTDGRPLLMLRPILQRNHFTKGNARNPDPSAFLALFNEIRKYFFVVSIADLIFGEEWLVGQAPDADLVLHGGELNIEQVAALAAAARLVFTPPCFAAVLAQAVATPSVIIFGGHESSRTLAYGRDYAPTLMIDPIVPCDCFDADHACDKRIDVPAAIEKLREFSRGLLQ